MTTTIAPDTLALASVIAHRLADVKGVRAVVLGGSWARGAADEASDIDLGIYYDPAQPPDLADLRTLAAALDDGGSGDVVTDFGSWGPWINGGGWLTIGGQRVDWIYRDLARVRQIFDECLAGRPTLHYQAGHPHAFSTSIYLGEIALCVPLHDPHSDVAALKARALPYPPALRRALIKTIWEAQFALDTTRKAAERGDVLHVTGSLFRCAATLAQVLFALNERYCLNEKGALEDIKTFAYQPLDFSGRVQRVLGHPGVGAAGLKTSVELFEQLVSATRALCVDQGFEV